MGKTDIQAFVCRPFCVFFKEGRKEDFICGGGRVIERLLKLKKLYPGSMPKAEKDPYLWKKHRRVLECRVCRFCSFRKKDCDFASLAPPADAEPCGGYVFLSLLIESRCITPGDLEEVFFD